MSFEFRPLSLPEDEETLQELLWLGFPELRDAATGTIEHTRWKFGASDGLSLLGFDGTRPVAFYGVLPRHYEVRGERHVLGLVVDVLSHPEVRRRGLFVATGRAAMERLEDSAVESVIGFPIRDDVMPGHLKVGWRAGFKLPVYVLPTGWTGRPAPGAPRWLRAFDVAAAAYRIASRPLRRRPPGNATWLPAAEFATHPVVQALCAPTPGADRLTRAPEFWRWRLSRPGAEYRCLVVEAGGSSAYAVVRALDLRRIPSLAVLDFAASGRAARDLALASMLDQARLDRLSTIAVCANRSNARSLSLGRSGFLRSPQQFTLIHRATSPDGLDERFREESAWRMSWLDSDTV